MQCAGLCLRVLQRKGRAWDEPQAESLLLELANGYLEGSSGGVKPSVCAEGVRSV